MKEHTTAKQQSQSSEYECFIGADPGLDGALVALDPAGAVTTWVPMPTKEWEGNRRVNIGALVLLFDALAAGYSAVAMIERVHAMPEQGVVSMFNFGTGYGALQAAAHAAGCNVRLVNPAVWKAFHLLIGESKVASIERASEVAAKSAPDFLPVLAGGRGDITKAQRLGVAEAYLIAEYARQAYGGRK